MYKFLVICVDFIIKANAKKGGGGTEVFYRLQGAGRLPIFVNGSNLNGGCGGRMDTTLTYVFPQNYNLVTLIKGPQDVRYGTMSAGGILFDRETLRLKDTNFNFSADGLVGSFNRLDFNTYLSVGNELGSLQGIYSDYSRDDYKDGAGQRVHSEHQRRSGTIVGALTLTETSALELSADIGRGEAAYADRAMDARTFDRESYQLRFQNYFDKDLLDLRAYYNSIDHIMDNYSLTNGQPKIGNLYNLSNPKRINIGVKAEYKRFLKSLNFTSGAIMIRTSTKPALPQDRRQETAQRLHCAPIINPTIPLIPMESMRKENGILGRNLVFLRGLERII